MAFSLHNSSITGCTQPMSDINVTPFVDVMLVLLVIFMITAPMMVQGPQVALPKEQASSIDSADKKLMVTVNKNKEIFIGDVRVGLEEFQEKLKANALLQREKEILFNADKSVDYGFVVKIMAIAKSAGASSIAMITEPNDG